MLRFLADESCDFAAVRALRAEGFDVLSVAEDSPGADDERVIELALHELRILLTEDKDFGQLVFAAGAKSLGVVLIRFPASARPAVAPRVLELVRRHSDRLTGSFIMLQPRRTRISALP
jgi:predicted nuclease of predicted toxin-antitoxin system